ncbi:hypothetical protein SO802_023828 [Lithocarpus litseifolius]|uniref:CCHC-type domain-containing protein n=1 Tax=Lithocarpus litseifolius TaxID=425828 RepID=A0AAW2CCM5_9ROSI
MAEELEALWSKLTFTEEEGEGIELGSDSTKAAREIGKNCLVMKILTKRTIGLEALRKHLRMLWKPNKGLQVSEIGEEMYLTEFGDGRDKKRILEMCPWSYEKQLILLQDFEGERVPKEITIKWTPFWVQIYSLPLKSMTRESGMEIGAKLGRVLDVDVPEKGVHWGKFLRVRVQIDAMKKLVRGKRVTIEGGESRWVLFKYERLPNFCYKCGRLDHGEKDCLEITNSINGEGEGCMQYGAWLRGEPRRRGGREQAKIGEEVRPENRPESCTHGMEILRRRDRPELGEDHVNKQNLCQEVGQSDKTERLGAANQERETFHGEGKVNLPQEKENVSLTQTRKESVLDSLLIADLERSIHREKSITEEGSGMGEERLNMMEICGETGPKETDSKAWAVGNSSPLAMSFIQEKGWVAEPLGPNSGHWKRLARTNNKQSPNVKTSPDNTKRKGSVPIQELDPNALSTKRKKRLNEEESEADGHESMVGGEALDCPSRSPKEFIEVVWLLMETPGEKNWEEFAIMAWLLWNNRNCVRHGGSCKSGKSIAWEASKYEAEVRDSLPIQSKAAPTTSRTKHWIPPLPGKYKVNIDAVVFKEQGCCGVGVVIRNDKGQLMGAMSKRVEFPWGALEAEAKAAEMGVCLAWDLGLKDIEVEGDSLLVAQALKGSTPPALPILKIVEGVKWYLRKFSSWTVVHTRRINNVAAHLLANSARNVFDCVIWVEDIPPIIEMQILKDVISMDIGPN